MKFQEIHNQDVVWRNWKDGGIQYWYAQSELYVIRKVEGSRYLYSFVKAQSPSEACAGFLLQTKTQNQNKIQIKCDELKALLLEKNRKYGNSALEPARIFSKANAVEQILVRIDDKLNRIKNRQNDEDEDVIMDLAGYLILLMVAREGAKTND